MTQEEIKYHNQLWYYKTYNQLIDKCIQLESDGYPEDMYTEVHHILPINVWVEQIRKII